MNVMSNNKQTQGHPNFQNSLFNSPNPEFNNYFVQSMFPNQNPINNSDISSLLNHMYMALSNQSRLLSYLVEKN
jgi:hypothetical protein